MSKPTIRFVVAMLISLGVIAVSAPSVQARLGSILQKEDVKSATVHVLAANQVFGRARYFQADPFFTDSYHECGSEDPTVDY